MALATPNGVASPPRARSTSSPEALYALERGRVEFVSQKRSQRDEVFAPPSIVARGRGGGPRLPLFFSLSPCAAAACPKTSRRLKGPSSLFSLSRLKRAISQCGLAEDRRAAHLHIGARRQARIRAGHDRAFHQVVFCRRFFFLSLAEAEAATRHANGHSKLSLDPHTSLSLSPFSLNLFSFFPLLPLQNRPSSPTSVPRAGPAASASSSSPTRRSRPGSSRRRTRSTGARSRRSGPCRKKKAHWCQMGSAALELELLPVPVLLRLQLRRLRR